MRYSLDQYHLKIEIESKKCRIPSDQLSRMQERLDELGRAAAAFASSELKLLVIHHPRSDRYHAEARLKLPGATLFTGQWDPVMDIALVGCLAKLIRKLEYYRAHPDHDARQKAEKQAALDEALVAPTDPAAGELGQAVTAGDYSRFRELLAGYEDWLRRRVGRWVQRFPEADERIGESVPIADVVEEVYLLAFEEYPRRPDEVPIIQWLDGLVNPAVKAIYRHWETERENVSLARTLRETPPGR